MAGETRAAGPPSLFGAFTPPPQPPTQIPLVPPGQRPLPNPDAALSFADAFRRNPIMATLDALRGATIGPSEGDTRAAQLGEVIGAGIPLLGGAKALRAARGVRAYHGSPYDFDRFDLSKIGKGQGAQTFGHGLYFAEAEPVARTYRDQLSGLLPEGWVTRYPEGSTRGYIAGMIGDLAFHPEMKLTPERAAELIYNANASMRSYPRDQLVRELTEGARLVKGNMYEVNLNVDPEQLLDLDLPLGEQSAHVRQAVTDVAGRLAPAVSGEHAYKVAASRYGSNPQTASDALRVSGVPGSRYLDQFSRGFPVDPFDQRVLQRQLAEMQEHLTARRAGAPVGYRDNWRPTRVLEREAADLEKRLTTPPTRNYVIWDDSVIDIMRKYGLLPFITGAAASQQLSQQPAGAQPPPAPPR